MHNGLAGLPANLLCALQDADASYLAQYLVAADEFVPPHSPAIPAKDLPTEAAAWEERVRSAVAESVGFASRYGAEVGVRWKKAEAQEFLVHADYGGGRKWLESDVEIWSLGVEIREGNIVILVLMPTQPTPRGPRLSRPIAATILSAEERVRLRKWQPGADKQEDLSVASLLVKRKATKEYLNMFGWFYARDGEAWVFKDTTTVKLEFEKGVVQRAVVDGAVVGKDADRQNE